MKAREILKTKKVDLLFLDIRMPVLNGIDFIKTLKHPPAIILTTAYREYALEGYDLDIVDYLLKPIPFDRFLKAVQRFEARMVPPSAPPSTAPDHIFLNVNRTHHKVVLDDILYLESLKDYVRFHTPAGRLVVKGNLGHFMNQLPGDRFVRIHRSYAVALAHVRSYNQSQVTIGEAELPIGVSYREGLKGRFLG
ncbi:MAG: LytTR family DNA-binding domain-containing protein [Bacteroidota bacterium]